MQHPKTWWYRILSRLFPGRCREIPEATNPDRILLRQFAIIKKYVYLQQFASGENPDWMHSHSWPRGTLAIGLWGSYNERRFAMSRHTRAPYIRRMGPDTIHQTLDPSKGHTSIFIGLGKKTDGLKRYFNARAMLHTGEHEKYVHTKTWNDHIQRKVKRI